MLGLVLTGSSRVEGPGLGSYFLRFERGACMKSGSGKP